MEGMKRSSCCHVCNHKPEVASSALPQVPGGGPMLLQVNIGIARRMLSFGVLLFFLTGLKDIDNYILFYI